jgi:hypothetical protein
LRTLRPAVDLVLDRPRQARSQFIFTEVKGREAIFSQTQKTARAANPGGRVPRRRTRAEPVTITVDTRERYPYRFAHQGAGTVRATVAAGDYAQSTLLIGRLLAAGERKSLDNLAATLSDGALAFQLQRLAELPLAAIVVEARYSGLFKLEHVNGKWLANSSPESKLAIRASRSSSPTHAVMPRTGPTASSPLPSRMQPSRADDGGRSQLTISDHYRLASCVSGGLREPRMWPLRYSAGWRSSITSTLRWASRSATLLASTCAVRVKRPTAHAPAARSTTRASLLRMWVAIGASWSLPTVESMRSASIAEMCVVPSRV